MAMTSEAKRALSRTIRELRARLIDELGEATERAYRLSISATKATLSRAARSRRARLEGFIEEQVRALPAKARAGAHARLHAEIIKDAAATLLQRLVYLRLLEAAKLRPVPVVTGGWESRGYKDFREAAPELVQPDRSGRGVRDDSEGYLTLLQLVFDELALDLPGLYGPVRMTSLVPIPAATLRAVIEALDDEALASVWADDTTLGWIYQYWNDPEREALDAKLAASKKLENHEIASKTQMFTERYMVEWLLHNSLGQMWLAMCRRHGWTADAERAEHGGSVLERLEARRADWRGKREAGEVALDALMPIAPGLEDRWKYWVPQPMPEDAVAQAPESVRGLKLLDPACGSGHFLVIAFELLFHLYQEEARHRGEAGQEAWSDRAIVESILEHNLHGIDIDPRAVQIAAAALMLKARQRCPDAEPRTMNLVAPSLSLSRLAADDPARLALYASVERETGIPPALTGRILEALAGADHLGTLLKVDAEIDAAIAAWEAELSQAVPDQGSLFEGFGERRRKRITAEHARTTLLSRLEAFLEQHSAGSDLGLRLRGEQLAAGVRFMRLVREGQYDLVVGNPPYQGTGKIANKLYIEGHYRYGKADLYAAFLERGRQLVSSTGILAMLTMRNWMFIKQFSALRQWLLGTFELSVLGDVDRGAFEDVADEVVAVVMSVFRQRCSTKLSSIVVQPTPLDDKSRDGERTKRKRAALLCQRSRFVFDHEALKAVAECPLIYWWTADQWQRYSSSPKLGVLSPARFGLTTGDNTRFVRMAWEVRSDLIRMKKGDLTWRWVPFILGAAGQVWFEPLRYVLRWAIDGLEFMLFTEISSGAALRNPAFFFVKGIAFNMLGATFSARAHRFESIIGNKGSSVFPSDVDDVLCSMNTTEARRILGSLNPSLGFEVGDVNRLAIAKVEGASQILALLEKSFSEEEAGREGSVEFRRPGPSSWFDAQAWAQRAVDRDPETPLPPCVLNSEPETAASHISFAIGVALGRFDASGNGVLASAPPTAIPSGILFLSDASNWDGLQEVASKLLVATWLVHGLSVYNGDTLKSYLQERFFPDVHRKMYENRPIYFPLSSAKKSFVAYVSIHRWTSTTLNDLLAEHLYPTKRRLEGERTDLRPARDGADKKAAKEAEKRLSQLREWLEELDDFIAKVEQCAERGPPPPDSKTTPREVDARYEMDLDDGVMINSAALWPLLEPQWKDPKKWWKELANAEGKKDYDWAHLAKRYFPSRVDAKCKIDPSLAVAHGCFWKYHAEKAYQWELRLQDEIRPDFTIDEEGSDAARAAFEAEHPDKVEALVVKEHQRRQRKRAKAGEARAGDSGDDGQGELDLAEQDAAGEDGDGDADGDGDEELSA